MLRPGFWDNNTEAQKRIQERNLLKLWTDPLIAIQQRLEGVQSFLPEAYTLGDESLIEELLQEIPVLEEELHKLEVRKMLSGEMDEKNCFLAINAGAGGTEACDWVQMLARMYERWVTRHGWQCEQVDYVEGDVAGFKSVVYKITGPFAYGYAKAERGVHRLVRISPFDSNAKRHTSFASVDVTPEVTDDIEINIPPETLRVDTYRASGAGGQHVNKTDSAVRITHIPSGIIVASQSQRSQIQNREYCLKILRSKLYEKEVAERHANIQSLSGEKKEIAWGNQIRNYVFQPYTLVKDTRTGVESGNVRDVMDGNIDPFIDAYLKQFG